jgi:uncharacterized membrane protein YbhN (UPF0104 family)
MRPRILACAFALGASYLLCAGAALYVIASGLGIDHVSLSGAMGVYFFSLAFSLIVPLPVDVGAIEVSGVGAWLAEGIAKAPAVAVVLIYLVFSLVAVLLLAAIGLIYLREQFRLVLRARTASGVAQPVAPAAD